MNFSELFIDKSKTLIINTDLAMALGDLNEAIVLNQLNYWMNINEKAGKNRIDGRYWVYNTYAKWREENFPYWSETTIKRVFARLESKGIVISANHNKASFDKTKWYTIDYEQLERYVEYYKSNNEAYDEKTAKNPIRPNWSDESTNLTSPIPENTTENKKHYSSISSNDCENENQKDHDEEIMDKANEITDDESILDGIHYYLEKYKQEKRRPHPDVTYSAMDTIIDNIQFSLSDCWEAVETENGLRRMIDKHFDTNYGKTIDYKINHFGTYGILKYQAYNCGMLSGID